MARLDGKVAFITGAARGQGRSHAVRLAQEGADVILIDICEDIHEVRSSQATEEDLAETVRRVEALGRRVVASKADVRDLERVRAVVDDGVAQLGGLDIVAGNAGAATFPQFWDQVTPQTWQTTLDVDLTGVWHTCIVSIPHLIERGGGAIILTSSVAGVKGVPFSPAYDAAKHGVVGIMRALANELGIRRIRVNCVLPGGVDTPMLDEGYNSPGSQEMIKSRPDLEALLMPTMPVPLMDPVDISNGVLYLASDEGRYVTGICLPIDCGLTCR
jgi:SDR family mycofactocin-dependent oxidoreductase